MWPHHATIEGKLPRAGTGICAVGNLLLMAPHPRPLAHCFLSSNPSLFPSVRLGIFCCNRDPPLMIFSLFLLTHALARAKKAHTFPGEECQLNGCVLGVVWGGRVNVFALQELQRRLLRSHSQLYLPPPFFCGQGWGIGLRQGLLLPMASHSLYT